MPLASQACAGNAKLAVRLPLGDHNLPRGGLHVRHALKARRNFGQKDRKGRLEPLPPADPLIGGRSEH